MYKQNRNENDLLGDCWHVEAVSAGKAFDGPRRLKPVSVKNR